jgi:hypothetical protein
MLSGGVAPLATLQTEIDALFLSRLQDILRGIAHLDVLSQGLRQREWHWGDKRRSPSMGAIIASAFCLTTTDHTLFSQRASCFGHDGSLALPVVDVVVGYDYPVVSASKLVGACCIGEKDGEVEVTSLGMKDGKPGIPGRIEPFRGNGGKAACFSLFPVFLIHIQGYCNRGFFFQRMFPWVSGMFHRLTRYTAPSSVP